MIVSVGNWGKFPISAKPKVRSVLRCKSKMTSVSAFWLTDVAKQHLWVIAKQHLWVWGSWQWEMTSLLCAHCLPENRTRARVRSFYLAKGTRQMAKFARYLVAKITANCSNSFCHFLMISSVSRSQRPLISFLHLLHQSRHLLYTIASVLCVKQNPY
jgi:hypothetical protein